jgi:hypothetical protein
MDRENLKKFISEELLKKVNKDGRVPLIDHFGISGYMCEPERIERLIFPIIDKAFDSQGIETDEC